MFFFRSKKKNGAKEKQFNIDISGINGAKGLAPYMHPIYFPPSASCVSPGQPSQDSGSGDSGFQLPRVA